MPQQSVHTCRNDNLAPFSLHIERRSGGPPRPAPFHLPQGCQEVVACRLRCAAKANSHHQIKKPRSKSTPSVPSDVDQTRRRQKEEGDKAIKTLASHSISSDSVEALLRSFREKRTREAAKQKQQLTTQKEAVAFQSSLVPTEDLLSYERKGHLTLRGLLERQAVLQLQHVRFSVVSKFGAVIRQEILIM